jgi:hypothetical protein
MRVNSIGVITPETERSTKMKRCIVLTLVCIGIASVVAIATSLNDPIRTLSQVEKADITAGLCHTCQDCMASRNCPAPSGCTAVGGTCESTNMSMRENLDLECIAGGSTIGGCGGYGNRLCYKYKNCNCAVAAGGGWTCNASATWTNMSLSFDKDPC